MVPEVIRWLFDFLRSPFTGRLNQTKEDMYLIYNDYFLRKLAADGHSYITCREGGRPWLYRNIRSIITDYRHPPNGI